MLTFLNWHANSTVMVLDEKYKETTAKLGIKQPCPLFTTFCGMLVPSEEHSITPESLYLDYYSFVTSKVGFNESWKLNEWRDLPDEIPLATAERFYKRMAAQAPSLGIRRDKRRQYIYKVKVMRNYRGDIEQGNSISLRRSHRSRARVSKEKTDVPLFKVLYTNKKKGKGCFATKDLPKDTVLCQYEGQLISREEAEERHKLYMKMKKTMVLVWLGENGNTCLDGHAMPDGTLFKEGENLARIFNHKKFNPNCQLVPGQDEQKGKFYLKTRRPVAAGIELFWSYDDVLTTDKKDRPLWIDL